MTESGLIERGARALYRAANDDDVSNAALDATFAAAEHSGDCTQECHTCLRCEAEWARRCARAVLAELETSDEHCRRHSEPEMTDPTESPKPGWYFAATP